MECVFEYWKYSRVGPAPPLPLTPREWVLQGHYHVGTRPLPSLTLAPQPSHTSPCTPFTRHPSICLMASIAAQERFGYWHWPHLLDFLGSARTRPVETSPFSREKIPKMAPPARLGGALRLNNARIRSCTERTLIVLLYYSQA